jgi:hypothetical protein
VRKRADVVRVLRVKDAGDMTGERAMRVGEAVAEELRALGIDEQD